MKEVTRMSKLITAFDKTQNIAAWGKEPYCKISLQCLYNRLHHNWEFKDAITLPKLKRGRQKINTFRDKDICVNAALYGQAYIARIYNLSQQRISQIVLHEKYPEKAPLTLKEKKAIAEFMKKKIK